VLLSVVSFVLVFSPSSVLKYLESFVIPAIICCLFLFGCNICFSVIYLDTSSFALVVLWSDWLSSMSVILFPRFVFSKPRCSLISCLCCNFGFVLIAVSFLLMCCIYVTCSLRFYICVIIIHIDRVREVPMEDTTTTS